MAETAPRSPHETPPCQANQDGPDHGPRNQELPIQEPLWRHVLGEQLRRLRQDRGETLAETAERAGVSPQYLSEMERGVKEPSSEMIAAVAGALGTTLVDLTAGVAESLRAPRAIATRRLSRDAYALAA